MRSSVSLVGSPTGPPRQTKIFYTVQLAPAHTRKTVSDYLEQSILLGNSVKPASQPLHISYTQLMHDGQRLKSRYCLSLLGRKWVKRVACPRPCEVSGKDNQPCHRSAPHGCRPYPRPVPLCCAQARIASCSAKKKLGTAERFGDEQLNCRTVRKPTHQQSVSGLSDSSTVGCARYHTHDKEDVTWTYAYNTRFGKISMRRFQHHHFPPRY